MSDTNPANFSPTRPLPERANLERLRKEAKQRLKTMRLEDSGATLATAQLTLAREYGFSSWRGLIAYVKSQSDKKSQLPDPRRRARPFWLQVFIEGVEAVGKEDYQAAVAHFRQAEAEYPALTLSTVQLAVTKKFGDERWSDMIAYIKSLPDKGQLRPIDSDVSNAFNDGLVAAEKGEYQTAVAHFRQALDERPLKIRAHYYLGRALVRLQNFSEALAAFEDLLKLDPENLPAHYEIGKLHLYPRNYPQELLNKYDPENLLANYEIGAQYVSPQNYADAVAKYKWLRSQSEKSTGDLDDSSYELFPGEPRAGNLAQNPFHRAYAAKLAFYLLDLIPPKVAEQYGLPNSRIIYDDFPKEPLIDDQPEALKPVTMLYKEVAEYTEIARINLLKGSVTLSAFFSAIGSLVAIRVVRGLPDGLTRRAIQVMKRLRFSPASLNGEPVSVRGNIEIDFYDAAGAPDSGAASDKSLSGGRALV
jgi:tetratricopeptide (TPR) repeat protein